LIYLDTHVVLWLFSGLIERFNENAKILINKNDLFASPVVSLELQYLFEINRITKSARTILADLGKRVGLRTCDRNFHDVIDLAVKLSWTHDPFDRIIVANALLGKNILITKDQTILNNYDHASW